MSLYVHCILTYSTSRSGYSRDVLQKDRQHTDPVPPTDWLPGSNTEMWCRQSVLVGDTGGRVESVGRRLRSQDVPGGGVSPGSGGRREGGELCGGRYRQEYH